MSWSESEECNSFDCSLRLFFVFVPNNAMYHDVKWVYEFQIVTRLFILTCLFNNYPEMHFKHNYNYKYL